MAVFLPVVTVYGSTAILAGPVEETHFFSFQTSCLMLIPFVLKGLSISTAEKMGKVRLRKILRPNGFSDTMDHRFGSKNTKENSRE